MIGTISEYKLKSRNITNSIEMLHLILQVQIFVLFCFVFFLSSIWLFYYLAILSSLVIALSFRFTFHFFFILSIFAFSILFLSILFFF